jgi:hypothetical protein
MIETILFPVNLLTSDGAAVRPSLSNISLRVCPSPKRREAIVSKSGRSSITHSILEEDVHEPCHRSSVFFPLPPKCLGSGLLM